jgi:Fur family peroxide stress response transcriptional regulator
MKSHPQVEERIQHFPERCKAAGLKVTHQRTAIYAMLANTVSHPSPEEVYSQIRRDLPSISLATVYKILDLFTKHGFLRKVSTENQVARYDANTGFHHHLICSHCGKIKDLRIEDDSGLRFDLPEQEGFEITHYDIIFHGVCADCKAPERAIAS